MESLGNFRLSLISWVSPSPSQGWKRQGEIGDHKYQISSSGRISVPRYDKEGFKKVREITILYFLPQSRLEKFPTFFSSPLKVSEPNIFISLDESRKIVKVSTFQRNFQQTRDSQHSEGGRPARGEVRAGGEQQGGD